MSQLFKRRSIPFKLTVYLLVLLIVFSVIVLTWFNDKTISTTRQQLSNKIQLVSQLLTEKLNNQYKSFFEVNSSVTDLSQLLLSEHDSVEQFVEKASSTNMAHQPFFFLAIDGTVFPYKPQQHIPFEVTNLNSYLIAQKNRESFWSRLVFLPDEKVWSMLYYQQVKTGENVLGYWVFSFEVDKYISEIKEIAKNYQHKVFIYDDNQQLIYHPDYGSRLIRQSELNNMALPEKRLVRQSIIDFIQVVPNYGHIENFVDWGRNHYAMRSQLNIANWTLVVYYGEEQITKNVMASSVQLSIMLVAGSGLILFIFVIFVVRSTSFRLRRVASSLNRAKNDNWQPIAVIDGSDEIDYLSSQINRLISFVTEQKQQLVIRNQKTQEEVEEYKGLAQAVSFSDNAVVMLELDYTISFIDAQGLNLLKQDKEQVLGVRFFSLIHPYMAFLPEQMINDIRRNQSWRGELVLKGVTDESQIWVNATITPMRNEVGEVTKYVVSLQDISFIKDSENKIEQLAYTDELTGLANRSFFKAQLEKLIEINKREHYEFVLLHIDIDDFKRINDNYGYEGGDELIKQIAHRLNHNLRSEDVISRIAGDEFALILGGIDTEQKVLVMINHILSWLSEPYEIQGKSITICCSIGLTMSKNDEANAELLLQHANMAMYEAKSVGKNTFHFFTAELNEMVKERVTIERELKHAIIKGELQLYFQPKVDIEQLEHVGFEALLRWYNPDLGHIGPDKFIPIAEQSNLILELSEWVVDKACLFIKKMDNPVPVSVNLSAKQFEAGNSAEVISAAIQRHDIASNLIEVEITETELMSDVDGAIKQLTELKALGVTIAIDDFGTGYASLNYLKRFPLDTIKIDREFIKDIPNDKNDMEITNAIVAMSESLGLKVIAEGVETTEQLEFLLKNGCHQIQGYFFSKPLPEYEALKWELKANWGLK